VTDVLLCVAFDFFTITPFNDFLASFLWVAGAMFGGGAIAVFLKLDSGGGLSEALVRAATALLK
jgi:hypothetical protein